MLLNIFKSKTVKPSGVLVIGHDLKFFTYVIDHFKQNATFNTEVYTYQGHQVPNKKELLEILPRFRVLFCEWGLGNIVFASHHKKPGQKLVVRIHSQGFRTNYFQQANWDHVDEIIFISPYMLQQFVSMFPQTENKCRLIYNLIDCNWLDGQKTTDAKYNLGLLGILPQSKGPYRGLEILNELKKFDSRFRLLIKSKRPEELDWLWKRKEERDYYEAFYSAINTLGLKDSVEFEPHGTDVPEWFSKIGFILSTSDFEGSHQSIAEGMASGSLPVIRNWNGASSIYPARFVYHDTKHAVQLIRDNMDHNTFSMESELARTYAREHFDKSVILPKYDELILSMLE